MCSRNHATMASLWKPLSLTGLGALSWCFLWQSGILFVFISPLLPRSPPSLCVSVSVGVATGSRCSRDMQLNLSLRFPVFLPQCFSGDCTTAHACFFPPPCSDSPGSICSALSVSGPPGNFLHGLKSTLPSLPALLNYCLLQSIK